MNRRHQLRYCTTCTKREQNLEEGIVCSLTGAKANFEDECKDFDKDNTVVVNNEATDLESEEPTIELSEQELNHFLEEQNYPKAVLAGVVVGIIGAILWGAVTVSTGYQIGYMAIAIGFLVGISMRYAGKGMTPIFGITGGVIALISCALGNLFSIIGFMYGIETLAQIDVLFSIDYGQLIPIMKDTFNFMDLIFYAIATSAGYKYAFRVITEEDLTRN